MKQLTSLLMNNRASIGSDKIAIAAILAEALVLPTPNRRYSSQRGKKVKMNIRPRGH